MYCKVGCICGHGDNLKCDVDTGLVVCKLLVLRMGVRDTDGRFSLWIGLTGYLYLFFAKVAGNHRSVAFTQRAGVYRARVNVKESHDTMTFYRLLQVRRFLAAGCCRCSVQLSLSMIAYVLERLGSLLSNSYMESR